MGAALDLASSRQFCCAADVYLIQRIVGEERPANTVIIGAGSGTMSLAYLEVRQPRQYLWSIDNDIDALYWERQAWIKAGFGKRPPGVTGVHLDSRTAGLARMREVDFLIVDGDHREVPLRGDLTAWLPHVVTNGNNILASVKLAGVV